MGGSDGAPDDRELLAFNRQIDWEREARVGTIFFGVEKSRQFPPLDVGTIRSLAEHDHIDLEASHNDSPPAGELLEFAKYVIDEYREYQLEVCLVGYMVSPDRGDSRVRLEGISIRSPGPIPDDLKSEVVRRFTPDLLTVDDFTIQMQWD